MKKKENKKHYDRGQVFVKVISIILAIIMLLSVVASTLYAIFM